VVVTMRAILVTFFEVCHIFPESFAALFAHKYHFCVLSYLVVGNFGMTFCAIKPFLATRCANRGLNVEDVFAFFGQFRKLNGVNRALTTCY
jgi:hypothetical protein